MEVWCDSRGGSTNMMLGGGKVLGQNLNTHFFYCHYLLQNVLHEVLYFNLSVSEIFMNVSSYYEHA